MSKESILGDSFAIVPTKVPSAPPADFADVAEDSVPPPDAHSPEDERSRLLGTGPERATESKGGESETGKQAEHPDEVSDADEDVCVCNIGSISAAVPHITIQVRGLRCGEMKEEEAGKDFDVNVPLKLAVWALKAGKAVGIAALRDVDLSLISDNLNGLQRDELARLGFEGGQILDLAMPGADAGRVRVLLRTPQAARSAQ